MLSSELPASETAGLRALLEWLRERSGAAFVEWNAPGPKGSTRRLAGRPVRLPGACLSVDGIELGGGRSLRWGASESRPLDGSWLRGAAELLPAITAELSAASMEESEPLVCAGEDAAGLVHDLRNALTLAQLELERAAERAGVPIEGAERALDEARALCVDFLGGLEHSPKETELHLRDLLSSELESAARLTETRAALSLRCPKGLVLHVEAAPLRRAVHNLVTNALRVCAPGERVRVRARRWGPGVVVTVEDRGRGMTQGELDRAMRPGSSTRGQGGGYGSASLLSCVRRLDARLSIRSQSGVGTRCRLLVPDLPR